MSKTDETTPMELVRRPDEPSNELAQVGMMLQTAVEKGVDAEGIKAVTDVYKEFADRDARQQFNRAFARFKEDCPTVSKNAKSHHGNYTSIDEMERVCGPHLRANGFSWWWDGEPVQGVMFKTTFVLEHEGGHAKSSHFTLPISTRAGMSDQDKFASAYSWGQRISMKSGLGLTSSDADAVPLSKISKSQAADLEALIDETKANRVRFLKYAGVEQVEDILLENYDQLCKDLRNFGGKR